MSKYKQFRHYREQERKFRQRRDELKKRIAECNNDSAVEMFNRAIIKSNTIKKKLQEGAYLWQDDAEKEFLNSVININASLKEQKKAFIDAYEFMITEMEKQRRSAVQTMINLTNSFDTEDWIECSIGEFVDYTKEDLSRIKSTIRSFLRKLAELT